MKGYFYAIGGANYQKGESVNIDLDMIKETKKVSPIILYVSAANNDNLKSYTDFCEYFEKYNAKVLILSSKITSSSEIDSLINLSDIIYISGGRTEVLYNYAIKVNLKSKILDAYNKGKIIAGVSAGAIIMFELGYGDKNAFFFNNNVTNHEFTKGLGIFDGVLCPHYQGDGILSFNDMIKTTSLTGYALSNGAAMKINEEGFVIIKEKNAEAFMLDFLNDYKLTYLNPNTLNHNILFRKD